MLLTLASFDSEIEDFFILFGLVFYLLRVFELSLLDGLFFVTLTLIIRIILDWATNFFHNNSTMNFS